MKIIECVQGSSEWFEARLGKPTASNFKRILTQKTRKYSAQAKDYIAELIGEQLSMIPPEGVENFTNRAIRWGQQCEEEARRWFSLDTGLEVTQVGLCVTDDDRFAASPDGIIGEDSGLELKCLQPGTQAALLLDDSSLSDYQAQIHGAMIVTGRKSWHLVCYCPGLPVVHRVYEPDSFTEALRVALEMFWQDYQTALTKIRSL